MTTTTTSARKPPNKPSQPMIDYTNLYIKNLDLNVKSSDLFNHFRKFGRIISARVMTNAETKVSKGFGFVSFSKTEEAYRALKEMNRTTINTKQIIVAFHEPKKPRADKVSHPPPPMPQPQPPIMDFVPQDTNNNNNNNNPYCLRNPNRSPKPPQPLSDLSIYMHTPPPPMPSLPQQPVFFGHPPPYHDNAFANRSPMPLIGHGLPDQFTNLNDKVNLSSKPSTHNFAATMLPNAACYTPSLVSLASGACINTSPPVPSALPEPHCDTTTTDRPMLHRRGSIGSMSSIMTEANSHIQRQRIKEAVTKCGETHHVDDIVDMILSLKRKDRSLCLFNQEFLQSKIDLAKGAIEAFQEEHGENHQLSHSPTLTTFSSPSSPHSKKESPLSSSFKHCPDTLFVSPPSTVSSSQKLTEQTSSPTPSNSEYHEIVSLLSSMENLSTVEKKQRLGDELFPRVKATGVRHAPKITIRLLDTVPLEELAFSMCKEEVLKSKVEAIANSLKESRTA
ncbi:hypothetical protein EC973_002263 [Apophysomyces ossiformis]|uniref:Uncharacterized protein n=1 Tax=Apophysomyces ossiformis TaxID=679940 RepID=A0A8H7ETU9_9FUNG|nr:hypothetical protein EC973_002263 [Apophysomyces ossiformis]